MPHLATWRVVVLGLILLGAAVAAPESGTVRAQATSTGAHAPDQLPGSDVNQRVESILRQMTLEEKIDYVGGVDGFYLRAIPRLGVPRLKMADGPFGVRSLVPSTTFAAGIALAATWNPALAERIGVELGRDSRARGVHFLLAPAVNIYRAPMNGRNFEYFGEDPLLAGRIATGYIKGIQSQGVSATAKHFAVNNSEFDRHHTDSVVDERTLREIYLPAFEAAVKDAKVGAIMTSYNLINGIHASQYGPLTVDVVKREWGFDGLIMSDWTSVYDAVGAANGGLDVEMPAGVFMNRDQLVPAVKSGAVPMSAIDDKVRRILHVAARFGWLDREQTDLSVPALNTRGTAVALEAAREGMVLLRNEGGVLPIDRKAVKTVAVIGPLAHPAAPVGGGSAGVQPYRGVSVIEGLVAALGPGVTVFHHRGIPTYVELADRTSFTADAAGKLPGVNVELFDNTTLSGTPSTTRVDPHVNFVGLFAPPKSSGVAGRLGDSSARWTGFFTAADTASHRLFVYDYRGEGGCRAMVDGKTVIDNWEVSKAMLSEATLGFTPGPHKVVLECFRRRLPGSTSVAVRLGIVPESAFVEAGAAALAAHADVVIAAVGFDNQTEAESGDRTFALPVGQDLLLRDLTKVNKKTVVTINTGGGVEMAPWIDTVPAVVMTWFAGEQGGTALAELLLGGANFSGRLPMTIERSFEDNPNSMSYYPAPGTTSVTYANGIFVGYRGYDRKNVTPLFPFGFGLSYTTFEYRNLSVTPKPVANGPAFQASFDVTNTGTREGADVAQVYVAAPAGSPVPRPRKELRGFAKVQLRPGESRRVSVDLDARAFSYWDTAVHQWKVDAGATEILVGPSSATTPLRQTVTVAPGTPGRR